MARRFHEGVNDIQSYMGDFILSILIPLFVFPLIQAIANSFEIRFLQEHVYTLIMAVFFVIPSAVLGIKSYFIARRCFVGNPARLYGLKRFALMTLPCEAARLVVSLLPTDYTRFGMMAARPANLLWNLWYFEPSGRLAFIEEQMWSSSTVKYIPADYYSYIGCHLLFVTAYLLILGIPYFIGWQRMKRRHRKIMSGDTETALSERK